MNPLLLQLSQMKNEGFILNEVTLPSILKDLEDWYFKKKISGDTYVIAKFTIIEAYKESNF